MTGNTHISPVPSSGDSVVSGVTPSFAPQDISATIDAIKATQSHISSLAGSVTSHLQAIDAAMGIREAAAPVLSGSVAKTMVAAPVVSQIVASVPSTAPTGSNGAFSQSLQNLTNEEAQISALTGLPANAVIVQASSAKLIKDTVAALKTAQAQILSFAGTASSQMQQIQGQLEAGVAINVIVSSLQQVQAEAGVAKKNVATALNAVNTASAAVTGYANTLAAIEQQLNADKTHLISEMNSAKDDAEAAKKKRWYFLALGPLGIAGAAAALALFITESKKASHYESQANALQGQIDRQNALVAATKTLGSAFVTLNSRILNVQSAVDIIGSDITEVIADTQSEDSRVVIGLHIQAATTEISSLTLDVS